MGLLTTYLAYKYGKRRAAEKLEKELEPDLREVCSNCGFERGEHIDNENEDCPA